MTGWDAIYNKAVKGKFKLTAQKAFENEVKLRGYTYLLWRSAKDAEAFVKSFKDFNVQTTRAGGLILDADALTSRIK